MSRTSWQAVAGGVLGLMMTSLGPDAAAEPKPTIAVRIERPEGSEGHELARARAIASEIFQQAGVSLVWTGDTRTSADRMFTLVLTRAAAAPAWPGADAMGVAPRPGDTAYVFIDRVAAFADAEGLAPAFVLACAMAHEIGHLLLPPNAHEAGGIMRASWRAGLFPPHRPGLAGFEPRQARLLRLRARAQ